VKVHCPDCGKKYLLKGRPRGTSIKCPKCSATIPLPEEAVPSRSALREELSRLASQDAAGELSRRRAPRVQVTDPEEEQFFSGRGRVFMLIAGLLLVLLMLGAGATWLVMRLDGNLSVQGSGVAVVMGNSETPDGDGQPPPETDTPVDTAVQPAPDRELPADVQRALWLARKKPPVCQEDQALQRWRAVLPMLKEHSEIASREIAEAEQQIAELSSKVQERRRQINRLRTQLGRAKEAAEAGRTGQARQQATRLIEQINRLQCSGPAVRELREQALALGEDPDAAGTDDGNGALAIKPPAIQDDPDHVLDKPKPGTDGLWSSAGWAKPSDVKLKGEAPDNLYRSIEHKGSGPGKWVVTMARPIDLTEYKTLMLDMRVQEQVSVALGVWLGNDLYESRAVNLRKTDKWQLTEFDLKSNDFKCEETNWQYGASLEDPAKATRFSLLFYSQARAPVLFANVRVHKGK
jgi:hypothetical protein